MNMEEMEAVEIAYLRRTGPYGPENRQLMERLKRYKPNHNRVYPLLWKLQEQGLVSMEEQSVSRRPRRKVYSLTNAGRAYFLTLLGQVEPEEFLESEEFLFRVEHFPLMDKKAAAQVLQARRCSLLQEQQENELRQEPVSKAYVSHRIQEEEEFLHHLEETYTR